ncbi:cell wall hydrolase [Novosphingobium sp.]|uniref:cell wall hydrolase n=1 Tax=Novosphingobium sp. TaxID=1874826 RepID=UPI00260D8A4A|nr:cell wall hydrolase [Novosphingobium sp.]
MASLPRDPRVDTDRPPPLPEWGVRPRNMAVRLVFAALFLAGLGAALTLLAPPPAGPQVRFAFPPPLPDPAALLPYLPETARAANAAMVINPPAAPAPAFRLGAADALAQTRALDCLSAAAWYEAGDDPSGERAVVQVVLNRARHPAFPASVCGVVFQGSERTTGCQFSFTCDGSMRARHPAPAAWARARAVAAAALAGAVDPRVGLATHYHADYVVPVWRSGLVKLAQVGLHLFYRWPGDWGSPAVLRGSASGEEPRIAAMAALSPAHGGADAAQAGQADAAANAGAALAYLPLDEADGPSRSGSRSALLSAAPAGGPSAGGRIALKLDPAAFPGTYAMRALAACGERERCAVVGELLGAAPGQDPGFVYLRDRRTGAEGAWWDCTALPRANPARCLPKGAALTRLLADWG